MMIRSPVIFIFILTLSSAATAQGLQIPEGTIQSYFNEIKVATASRRNLWDLDLYHPILLVDPDTRAIYANFPDSAGILKQQGLIYTGLLPEKINIANTALHWNGTDWAMVRLPLPENLEDRIDLLAHELFHVAQPQLGFSMSDPGGNNHLDQKEGRISLRLELEALNEALLAQTSDERKKHLTYALTFREYRHSIYPDAKKNENILEMNEGLAEYTGFAISTLTEEQSIDHLIKKMEDFYKTPSFVRSFPYVTIPVYGYLLSITDNFWNKKIDSSTNLTDFFIQSYHITIPQNLKETVDSISGVYRGQSIRAGEGLREERARLKMGLLKAIFVEQPHLEIRIIKMSFAFDPQTIIPLEDKGSVYSTVRVSDEWGILSVVKGALISPLFDRITVSKPMTTEGNKISGDGWTLQLDEKWKMEKDPLSDNYKLVRISKK